MTWWRLRAVALAVAHLLLAHLSSGMNNNKVNRTIDIAMHFDMSSETINQTCNPEPISNISQWEQNITEYFNKFFINTGYHLGRFTVKYTEGKWGTMAATQSTIETLHHAILFWGSDKNVKIAGAVANTQSAPVISLYPRHSWYRDGPKLPNVVVPRTGQSLKGKAALDLVKPPDGGSVEVVGVVREEEYSPSPELEVFNNVKRDTPGVFVIDFPLSANSLELTERDFNPTIDATDNPNPDSIIVDSNLGGLFYNLMVATIANGGINDKTIIIFLHEFYDVQKWYGLSELAKATSYIFAFQQRVPTSFDLDMPFYEAVASDALQGVARAALTSNFSYNVMDREPVHLRNGSFPLFNITHLTGGDQLVSAMKKLCFRGNSGNVSFTSGEALQDSCLSGELVEFDIMRVNQTNLLANGSKCENNWFKDGSWTGTGGLQRNGTDELWKLSVNDQKTANSVRVLLVPFGPFIYLNETGMWAGVDWDLLEFIANDKSVGFSMPQVQVTRWNGTRDEALKEISTGTNASYDLVIGAIISDSSTANVNYTRSYFTLRMGVVILKGGKDSNVMWRFIKPFSWDVWLAAVGVILGGGIVSKWLGLTRSYEDGLWIAACTIFFMQENRLVQMRNPFGRIFIIALSAFILILISAYTANMVSFLSPTGQPGPAFDPTSSVLVTLDQEPYIWLQSTGYNITTVSSVEQAIRRIRQGSAFAFIADLPLLRQTVLKAGPGCDLASHNNFFAKQQYAFAVSRKLDSKIEKQINQVIANAIPQSIVENSYLRHMKHDVTSACWEESSVEEHILAESANDSEESLGVNSFAGVAVVLACAAALCLTIKGLIILRHNYRKVGTSDKA